MEERPHLTCSNTTIDCWVTNSQRPRDYNNYVSQAFNSDASMKRTYDSFAARTGRVNLAHVFLSKKGNMALSAVTQLSPLNYCTQYLLIDERLIGILKQKRKEGGQEAQEKMMSEHHHQKRMNSFPAPWIDQNWQKPYAPTQ